MLDALLTSLLMGRSADTHELADLLRACSSAMRDVSQEVALTAAHKVALLPAHCLPLLKQAPMRDPDDEAVSSLPPHTLAAAAAAVLATCCGSVDQLKAWFPCAVRAGPH